MNPQPDVTTSVVPRPSPINCDIISFSVNLNRESGLTNHTQMCVTHGDKLTRGKHRKSFDVDL